MAITILLSLVLGVVWGRFCQPYPAYIRRGVPTIFIILGVIFLRIGVNRLGVERVEAGELDAYGIAGMLMLITGLVALLTLVVGHLTVELKKASKAQGRR